MSMKWRQTDPNMPDNYVNIASDSRAKEKKEIVDALLGQGDNVGLIVLPVVGMGGMGKITLAQLVYHDSAIQKHFQVPIWVCVSENFDVDSLFETIVKEAEKNGCQMTGGSTMEKFKSTANKWDKLRSYLHHGAPGSSVLTTTRDENIARFMGTMEAHKFKHLEESYIEKIIKNEAFSVQAQKPDDQILNMVGDVAKRCSGSPLAATALGSVLHTKNTVQEWEVDSMGKECAAIDTKLSQSEDFSYSAHHLFLSVDIEENVLNASIEKGSPALQTLICYRSKIADVQKLSKYLRPVRALKTRQGPFLKPKYLHHLRYLDLSRRNIVALPEDITILYHLQTLNLSYCTRLEQLPKAMKYMTALRHLHTHGCDMLMSMPPNLGHLSSLQKLTCFVLGTGSGCSNMEALKNLDLGGQLELRKLENAT
ncbi:unnamed protein product [Miscanthus lutarioriparius]|uniref:NB-ARC domain-containing protein n=1 Tax=Miscanthus lutarioriparius TaxID=422564 RepID=A0A811SIR2_9POAL|nr:unnamed protein product [Miscanthus lutarioriparius]